MSLLLLNKDDKSPNRLGIRIPGTYLIEKFTNPNFTILIAI